MDNVSNLQKSTHHITKVSRYGHAPLTVRRDTLEA